MAMVIMRDGSQHLITEERGKNLLAYLNNPTKKFINLNGNGLMVSISAISSVLGNQEWEESVHTKNGDRQCKEGHWYGKSEQECYNCKREHSKLSILHQPPTGEVPFSKRGQWLELIRRNMAHLRQTGQYGGLRKLEDLTDVRPNSLQENQI